MEMVIILTFMVVMSAVIVGHGRYRRRKLVALFDAFATRHGGTFEEKKAWVKIAQDIGVVTVEEDGQTFLLDFRIESSGDSSVLYTRFQTSVSQPFLLEVMSSNLVKRLTNSITRGAATQSGYPDYDDRFLIYSSHPTWARLLISRSDAWRAYQLEAPQPISIKLEEGNLCIEYRAALDEIDTLESFYAFVRDATALIRETQPPLLGSEAEGRLSLAAPEDHEGALTISKAGGGELTEHED